MIDCDINISDAKQHSLKRVRIHPMVQERTEYRLTEMAAGLGIKPGEIIDELIAKYYECYLKYLQTKQQVNK